MRIRFLGLLSGVHSHNPPRRYFKCSSRARSIRFEPLATTKRLASERSKKKSLSECKSVEFFEWERPKGKRRRCCLLQLSCGVDNRFAIAGRCLLLGQPFCERGIGRFHMPCLYIVTSGLSPS